MFAKNTHGVPPDIGLDIRIIGKLFKRDEDDEKMAYSDEYLKCVV